MLVMVNTVIIIMNIIKTNNPISYFRLILVALSALILSSCALEPGMHMEADYSNFMPGSTPANQATFQISPVTIQLLNELQAADKPAHELICTNEDIANYEYRVGPQDVLSVIVWDHPELTMPTGSFRSPEESGIIVRTDGTIFYPYIGMVPVAGKTLSEIREIVAISLTQYLEKPQVDVRVASYRNKKIHITGEVIKPGIIPLTDIPLTLLDVINQSGWFTENADRSQAILTRDGKSHQIALSPILKKGNSLGNCLMQNNDVLHFPDNSLNKVFVIGEVASQSSLFMENGKMTLADAILDSGGISLTTSEPGKIYVIRNGLANNRNTTPHIYQLNADSPKALLLADQFPMKPRDIVFVATAAVTRWNRVLSQILPTATMLDKVDNIRE